MNLVADEGLDAPIVHDLRLDGHTVWYVAELSPSIPDQEVLALAFRHDAVLVTVDKDCGA
jgi:predicted nuclease of predicted toxin-antitoxin system